MRKILMIAGMIAATPAVPAVAASGVNDQAMSAWIAMSTSLTENPGDYFSHLPYATSTGAYGMTYGELMSLGIIAKGSSCGQECFGTDYWEGTPWIGDMDIQSRKDFAESVEVQDYMMRSRILVVSAMIDGYVDKGYMIGYREITEAGALSAASLIGPYGFRAWRNGGYGIDAIPDGVVSASGMSRQAIYAELVRRLTTKDLEAPVVFENGGSAPKAADIVVDGKKDEETPVRIDMGSVEAPR